MIEQRNLVRTLTDGRLCDRRHITLYIYQVPKVAQSWRVAGDNQDDWEGEFVQHDEFCTKMMNFVFKMMNFALQMMTFVGESGRDAPSRTLSTTRSSVARMAGTTAISSQRAARAVLHCRHPQHTARTCTARKYRKQSTAHLD